MAGSAGGAMKAYEDNFATLYAARKLGRRSIGIDIDERSAEHLRQRMGTQGVMF